MSNELWKLHIFSVHVFHGHLSGLGQFLILIREYESKEADIKRKRGASLPLDCTSWILDCFISGWSMKKENNKEYTIHHKLKHLWDTTPEILILFYCSCSPLPPAVYRKGRGGPIFSGLDWLSYEFLLASVDWSLFSPLITFNPQFPELNKPNQTQ